MNQYEVTVSFTFRMRATNVMAAMSALTRKFAGQVRNLTLGGMGSAGSYQPPSGGRCGSWTYTTERPSPEITIKKV